MKTQIEYFFAALRFFTRLPVPAWVEHSQAQLNHAARYFPLVGMIVGGMGALVTLLCALVLPWSLALVFGMAATVLTTGAFHEDGFADSCDGFGGGWEKSQILNIMKDSRVGSYAVIGVVLLLLAKWNALVEILHDERLGGLLPILQISWPFDWLSAEAVPELPVFSPELPFEFGSEPSAVPFSEFLPAVFPAALAFAMIAGHAVSRFAATLLIATLAYAREDETAKSKPLAQKMGRGELLLAAFFGLSPCLLLPWSAAFMGVLLALLTAGFAARYFVRRIGGYTGDCLGAVQQLSELAFYCGLLCRLT